MHVCPCGKWEGGVFWHAGGMCSTVWSGGGCRVGVGHNHENGHYVMLSFSVTDRHVADEAEG